MPKQLGSALILTVALIAIVVASNRADEYSVARPANAARALASTRSVAPFRHTEKLHGPVEVAIDLIGPPPAAAGDVFVLQGVISSEQSLKNVEYRWAVPASVEVVNGRLNDRITELGKEHAINVELTLRARDAGNAQVHLIASARAHGARFAESAQYNTTREAAFAAGRAALMKSTEASQTTAPGELKVYH